MVASCPKTFLGDAYMFDYSHYSSVMHFELSDTDLWALQPQDVRNIENLLLIPELVAVTNGSEFEILCFGYYAPPENKEENPHIGAGFSESLAAALDAVPHDWNPSNPKPLVARLILYYVKSEIVARTGEGLEQAKAYDVRIYPTLGTNLDYHYSADAVLAFGDRFLSVDMTSDPDPQNRSRADIVVYRDRIMLPGGIRALAGEIVDKMEIMLLAHTSD